jgi:nicotinate-nucleotide adenylyltransferase
MDYTDITEQIRKYLKKNQSRKRYRHSVRTAETAVILARRYGIDPRKAYFCGLAHDITRDWDIGVIRETAEKDGEGISVIEERFPVFLHGRAGSVFLHDEYGIDDPSVLNAVKYHITGDCAMDDLAKIVYIADVLEPGRKYHHKVRKLYRKKRPLDGLLYKVVKQGLKELKNRGKEINPATRNLYKKLKKERKAAP